jgi:hypothetical protein
LVRIAVTGHMNLTADSIPLVTDALADALAPITPRSLVGISCIAQGADAIFAQAVLDHGGQLEVIIPAANYRSEKVKPDHAATFDELLQQASKTRVLPYEHAGQDAYQAANNVLLTTCDTLFAVWDGQDGKRSGTASVVQKAQEMNLPVRVIWPPGAQRG